MSDFLKRLCLQNKIKLFYTDNDYTILSTKVSNNTPMLKVYNNFSDCPEYIAKAIFDYYTTENKKSLKVLEDYIEDDLFFLGYEIDPPDKMFLDLVNNNTFETIPHDYIIKEKVPDFVERGILSITKKDFYGSSTNVNPTQNFKVVNDSVVEFDIIINDN